MHSHRLILLVAVAALSLTGSSGFSEGPRSTTSRLPTSVTPLHYTLQIEPDLDTATVSGTVIIQLQTTSNQSSDSVDAITLHLGADSEVDEESVTLVADNGTSMTDLSVIYMDDDSMIQVALPLDTSLELDTNYTLTMSFSSPLYTEPKGLFWGSYNSTSKYVASAFRATYARNLFPCFDEPQYQVPLVLKVVRPSSYNVTFTTSLESSEIADDDKMLDTFVATPANISLSSLGLFMTEIVPVTAMGVTLYVPAGYNTSVAYLETLIDHITSTLGDFPSPNTLRLVVLPDLLYTSFSSLGFVFTSPEVYLGSVAAQMQWLELSQQLAEQFLQQYLAFTHTPQWWSDLWLSDSLAAYLAIMMSPQSTLQGPLTTLIRINGFNQDYGSFSGAVVNPLLEARLDIESAIANQTIKNKGLSVLMMWHNTLPEGLLKETVLDFINTNKTLTTTDDFLSLLTANLESQSFFDDVIEQIPYWLNSVGNPVLNITARANKKATIVQSPEGTDDVLWPVSVSLATNNSHNWNKYRQDQWITTQSTTVTAKKNLWLVLNLESAPYRVNYGSSYDQLFSALVAANSSSIPAPVRAAIQSDALDLALSGRSDLVSALMIMNNTQHDQEDWMPVVRALDTMAALMGTSEWGLSDLGGYLETMFTADLLDALDLTNSAEYPDQWLARSLLTPWLCRFDIGNCRTAVTTLAPSALLGDALASVDENDLDNVACLGGRYQATSVDSLLTNLATGGTLAARRLNILALGCVVDPDSVQKVLTSVTNSSSQFSVREVRDIMVGLASSAENAQTMASFIVAKAESLQDMIGSAYLSDVIKTLGKFRIHATKLESLADDDVDVEAYVSETALATVAKINASFAWWSVYGEQLLQALSQNPGAPTPPATVASSAAPIVSTDVFTSPKTQATTTAGPALPTVTTTAAPVSAAPLTGGATLLTLLLLALVTSLVGGQ